MLYAFYGIFLEKKKILCIWNVSNPLRTDILLVSKSSISTIWSLHHHHHPYNSLSFRLYSIYTHLLHNVYICILFVDTYVKKDLCIWYDVTLENIIAWLWLGGWILHSIVIVCVCSRWGIYPTNPEPHNDGISTYLRQTLHMYLCTTYKW